MNYQKYFKVEDTLVSSSPLKEFMASIPNTLGINLNSVKGVHVISEADKYGQLVSLRIDFIPSHDPQHLEGLEKYGLKPWLSKKEDSTINF